MTANHNQESQSFTGLPAYRRWAEGYSVIMHQARTNERVLSLAQRLVEQGRVPDPSFRV